MAKILRISWDRKGKEIRRELTDIDCEINYKLAAEIFYKRFMKFLESQKSNNNEEIVQAGSILSR